ncbi:oleosin 20.3 kDa-like [Dioscorea cayenensis subsp. rotundata]|uniref:Oleosin 20.3 kDa-like n=1 Tax=Dioscorea cayennensis subsp. rotundata TaxID=55577 RepID=A0AB40BE30_DIOCR|nr:oleosin 20.3 kDa-like [Dioscorea cayenensis subsp. rotundata]
MAMVEHQQQRPSVAKVLALITLLPVGGGLLGLSGVTLAFTVLGLAVATPLFLLCSPVLLPAVVVISLAVMGFLASGAMGLTGLSSLSWILDWLKRLPELIEQAKRRMGEAAGHATQRAREVGQSAQSKVQESGR